MSADPRPPDELEAERQHERVTFREALGVLALVLMVIGVGIVLWVTGGR